MSPAPQAPVLSESETAHVDAADAERVLATFVDAVEAARHVARILGGFRDDAPGQQTIDALDVARLRLSDARAELLRSLRACGVVQGALSPDVSLPELVAPTRRVLSLHGLHVFYTGEGPGAERSLATVAVGRVAWRERGRIFRVDGQRFECDIIHLDRLELGDWTHETLRTAAAATETPTSAVFRPIYIDNASIIVDRAAIRRVGQQLFFPRVEHYRRTAREVAAKPETLDHLASRGDARGFLGLARDVWRWKALGPLVNDADASGLGPQESLRRFVSAYARFEELRAAVILGWSRRADAPVAGELRQAISRAGLWAQLGYGDAAGTLTNLLSLALGAQGQGGEARADDRVRPFLEVLEQAAAVAAARGTNAATIAESDDGAVLAVPTESLAVLCGLDASQLREIGIQSYRRERDRLETLLSEGIRGNGPRGPSRRNP